MQEQQDAPTAAVAIPASEQPLDRPVYLSLAKEDMPGNKSDDPSAYKAQSSCGTSQNANQKVVLTLSTEA